MKERVSIREKLTAFKRRYYNSLLLRGSLLSVCLLLSYFLLTAVAEYFLWLPSFVRLLFIILFVAICLLSFYLLLRKPLMFYLMGKGMSDEDAARFIGQFFPQVRDKLLNWIQLANKTDSALALASVQQKAKEFEPIAFESSVNLQENKRYLRYLAVPVGILVMLLLINASVITGSTYRIVHFRKAFTPEAPFLFLIQNENLQAFRNEDFNLQVILSGSVVPDQLYLVSGANRYKMQSLAFGQFGYLFENIQNPINFYLEAGGYRSPEHQILVAERPELESMRIDLQFPAYLKRKSERVDNAGPLLIPEGTLVNWTLRGNHVALARIKLYEEEWSEMEKSDNQIFKYSSSLRKPGYYEIQLENEFSLNREQLRYPVEIIKDQYPEIVVTHLPDSVYYKRLLTGGIITDDHGLTELRLVFHMKTREKDLSAKTIKLPITAGLTRQSFYYVWPLDTLNLKPGDELLYYLEVFDNDGVNGRKSTRSANYSLRLPDKNQVQSDIVRSQQQTMDTFKEGVQKAKQFGNELEDARQKLKGRQSLDWQDKKRLEDLIEKRKSLDDFLRQLNEQNRNLENKKDAFTEQDERLREKARQIQKLMDELLDEETKKLLEELQRLLQENAKPQDIQKMLDQLDRDSRNLEKELQRTLELMKRLQFDYQLDQTIRDLKDVLNDQKELLEETEKAAENKNSAGNETQELAKEQEEIRSSFEKIQEKLKDLEKLGEEIGENLKLPEDSKLHEVENEMNKSRENLEQNKPGDAKTPQRKAIEGIQQLSQQIEQEMEGALMEINMANLELLRHILHGLIKISFDQEQTLNEFKNLSSNDPKFNVLAQRQLKIKDDVKVLEDSLLALASRDPMMGSFVTREITNLDENIGKAIEANKEKRRGPALTAMQLSMTSINNLALMLDSHYDAMMQMMENARPSRSSKSKNKNPRLSELQRQLNEKIEELKNSGKQGRQLSEELARLAAEQERIRKALREFEEKLKQEGGKTPGDGLQSKMEETEMDLVNKQLTEELIQRQRDILTRLLEAENSLREQDFDDERKGETARDYEKIMPKAIEDYLRKKEKETELLRTLPPRLYPYYQREIDEYLKRLRENSN
ncbi:MAG: hypothetical protein N2044_01150 [Cyclobacteriaceae bacterium]|nr:hypothetical protein [Cyclobacteriaceae bacterium]MCX7636429.1 hypothetical protein [Cyclobacteriaceae bacterium]